MSTDTESSEGEDVLFEQINATGIIDLNRPKALNSINLDMIQKIYAQVVKWEDKSNTFVKQVIIKSDNGKAFCAGGDIVAVMKSAKEGTDACRRFFYEEYILNHKLATYRLPYIAIIDGITMGGGVGLSIHGAFRVATDRTLMAMPETAIGLLPDVGSAYRLSRLPNSLGTYLTLTGHRLRGRDVLHTGIATHYVKSELIPELVDDLIETPKPNQDIINTIINKYHSQSKKSAEKEFCLQPYLQKISDIFSLSSVEDIMTALEKDGSEWAIKQLTLLHSMSPTSMKITLQHMTLAAAAPSVAEVLTNDYRLACRCMDDHDFIEGVRSKLIDKDDNPQWKPATLGEVSQATVDHYFSPLPPDQDWHPPTGTMEQLLHI